jgi:hypothetical protein
MKKALVIFAASSMLATGVSLASNVSFGQKMAAFLSEAFEFVGPVSGLVHALVKHNDAPKTPVIPNFEAGLSAPKSLGNGGPLGNTAGSLRTAELVKSPSLSVAQYESVIPSKAFGSDSYADLSRHSFVGNSNRLDAGSVARAITESGENTVLANLGKSLQGRFQDSSMTAASQDVWSSLMSKPGLEPTKLALVTERSNKQEDAGAKIAQSVTSQGLTQNAASTAANILNEANAAQGTSVAGSGGQTTASQITPTVLAQATVTSPNSSKVPAPGGLPLMLIGIFLVGIAKLFAGRQAKA